MPIQFTRREKHVLIIVALTLIAIVIMLASGVEQSTLDDYEFIWLIFYVTPLGIYIATDPERRKT